MQQKQEGKEAINVPSSTLNEGAKQGSKCRKHQKQDETESNRPRIYPASQELGNPRFCRKCDQTEHSPKINDPRHPKVAT